MRLFYEKLCDMVPVITRKSSISRGSAVSIQTVSMEKMPEGDYFSIPYLQAVEELGQKCNGLMGKRIFLVTGEEVIGMKAALSLLSYPFYEDREEIREQAVREGYHPGQLQLLDSEGRPLKMRLISLRGERKGTENVSNPYLPLVTEVTERSIVFFTGLEEGENLEEKMEIVLGCPGGIQFVLLKEEALGTPWVRELMMDRECELVRIPRVENTYYEQVVSDLLEGERYRLAKELSIEGLVRNIRRKCAGKFAEEDMAWSLDQAVKQNALREGDYVLEARDFSIESWENSSPYEQLQRMTGLEHMKKLALEYAALSREQARNKQLSDICRHAVFQGKPGTGKTMCGKLLAQIMAEEGQSNGTFVVASRKDIVGQYVGHTAPRVARLFDRAGNGVLFVDEAGFFLQDEKNSFTQEALKEFVRYMELYQDVTVIFALYPHEVKEFLQLDAGISSRIGRVVEFPDYTREELVKIAEVMCRVRGYQVEGSVPEILSSFILRRKAVLGDRFGNAREMRKLVEAAIIARSIRCFEKERREKALQEEPPMLTAEDFRNGIDRLGQEKAAQRVRVGFVLPDAGAV